MEMLFEAIYSCFTKTICSGFICTFPVAKLILLVLTAEVFADL